MRSVLLFAFLSLMPAFLFGQSTVTGIVLDSLTQEPLPSATVYINGTTHGTTTDADGRFELEGVSYPATVISSFVGYKPKALDLTRNPGRLTIMLKTNDELPEVDISGKIDKKDMEYFKSMFLGDDRWGKRATIKNENALNFYRSEETSYEIRKISRVSYSIPTIYGDLVDRYEESYDTAKVNKSVFSVKASEPLIIDLPLLGYELYVDLVKFSVTKVRSVTKCNMLGFFYYKPYDNVNKRKAKSFEKNRKRAYWGSSQHFLRSFYERRLSENGFLLTKLEKLEKKKKNLWVDKAVDIKNYSAPVGDNMMQIYGLKDKDLTIRYYHRNDGSPYVGKEEEAKGIRFYNMSGLKILKDTCLFFKDGTVMDNNIVFTLELSKKKVGACLPADYYPPEDTSRITVRDSVDYASELIKFADNIHRFNNLFPQEKVYLEFDNTAYFQGEDIWFKAFVTHATTLERAPSGVLYVDFLAPTGQLIKQQKLKIVAGQADGVISLLDAGTQQTREKQGILAYPSGFYEIRAYTQNMLDFTPEAVFSRVIPVYTQPKYVGEYDRSHVVTESNNPLIEKIRGKSIVKNDAVNVTFYPEGGDLIYGLPCRVAFKATGSDGFGIDGKIVISGTKMNFGIGMGASVMLDAALDSAFTVHDGMGSFIIKRDGNENVYFITSDGERIRVNLPRAASSGYSMMTDMNSDKQMQVNIWRTNDCVGEQTALAVTCRGDVLYFEEIKDMENSQLDIDCSEWPVGVCRVTLFNNDGMILASRSIFHGGPELSSPTIAVNTDSMSRQSLDKEVIEFTLTDQEGNPFRDRFCLSVRDATDYGGGRTDNLQTNLLLSSDLRGYIHDPAWYLESDDDEHREALDLLTLVQGWERYEWQTMAGLKEFEEKHRIEESLTMNGWILSYGKREPVSDIGVYASVIPDDDKTLFESFDYQTDSTGYFGFNMSDFYGKGKFTIHIMSHKKNGESKYETSKRIRFERGDRPQPRPYLIQETNLSHNTNQVEGYKVDYTDYDLTPAQRRKLGKMIDDVDIEEETQRRRFIDYDTFTSFEAEEDAEFELDQGEYTTDLRGYFLERGIRFGVEELGAISNESAESGNNTSAESGDNANSGIGSSNWSSSKTKYLNPLFYVHNQEKLLTQYPFDDPYSIDMIDVKSIIVYDEPKYPRDMVDLFPLMMEWVKKHAGLAPPGVPAADFQVFLLTSFIRFNLIDVQIKNDRELLFFNEIRNLGKRSTTVKGFTKPVQFYSPQYPDGPIEGTVDPRRTLYWNPNVITDEEGHARVEFYKNSFTRRFTIRASGITASGIPYTLNQNW